MTSPIYKPQGMTMGQRTLSHPQNGKVCSIIQLITLGANMYRVAVVMMNTKGLLKRIDVYDLPVDYYTKETLADVFEAFCHTSKRSLEVTAYGQAWGGGAMRMLSSQSPVEGFTITNQYAQKSDFHPDADVDVSLLDFRTRR